ncbi:MAG: alpha-galactosidase [Bacteroidetes bacterium]|nr:alpha-galactosidase [Bacteroidota bacterium]
MNVHYELYDGLPVFCKWITVENQSGKPISVNKFKSEVLALYEPESTVDPREKWIYPNITVETDYNFGGMTKENLERSSISWSIDPLYKTQVHYERKTPCLLEVYPKYGPEQEIAVGETFSSYRVWELLHDSWNRERKGLEHRRMMRAIAPWVTENPILMHVRSAKDEAVKKAIDQCVEVGFEKVIMTFGSGFNAEDASNENITRMKKLADYAHSKGITLGGYSLLASRRVSPETDVVMPEGKTPRFGNSPCIESEWGQEYFRKLYNLYEKTGLDNFEHDGSYPGDICISENHPGHKGLEDSQWNQYKTITDFYKWCRAKGIYLNIPDYYFLSGSNKTAMGYRETNWSLPRAQQEIIERQNIYDGTWTKAPSMGWMFVPLVQYHGGGEAATIEPLKEHLPHYGQRLANLFGAGVQACYRGPQLYDAPETKILVKKWVDFYKKYRRILDGDVIHIRRPDGCDYDAILHVEPTNNTKGMLVVYNPLNEAIKRKIKVNLYYTGLKTEAKISQEARAKQTLQIDRDYNAIFEMEIPAKSQTWFTIE